MIEKKNFSSDTSSNMKEVGILEAYKCVSNLCLRSDRDALLERLAINDPVVRVWALSKLLSEGRGVTKNIVEIGLHVARRSAYLRRALHSALIGGFRFSLAAKLIEHEKGSAAQEALISQEMMRAQYVCDYQRQVKCHTLLYLHTGYERHLFEAFDIGRTRLPWREVKPVFLRALFTQPKEFQNLSLAWLKMLQREDERLEFGEYARAIRQSKQATVAVAFGIAQEFLWGKKYSQCVEFLQKSNTLGAVSKQTPMFTNMAAVASEKAGNYRAAAEYYGLQNDVLKEKAPPPERYIKECTARGELPIAALPKDHHTDVVVMTGFPRSGTTLLEHILDAHPHVVTCEETSSLTGTLRAVYGNSVPDKNDPELTRKALEHREIYYKNLFRYVHKKNSKTIIDKTPIMSINIKYMEKIFAEKRYLFSIRHPYDVVLSNWKQEYQQNVAMSAFNDINTACELYHYTMSNWFDVFPNDDERVCYVKYDDLVTDFEPVVRRVLAFLEVEWDESVKTFADRSQQRAVRTPSYSNVRQGLSIGVQTSWRQFEFLFDERCRALLDPWVRRFGYET